jgi:hypothetical protein
MYSRILLIFAIAAAFVLSAPCRADGGSAGAADVQVMVFPAVMFPPVPGSVTGEDHVTFTYATGLTDEQAMKDFLAYSKITARTLHDVQISTGRTALSGAASPVMTCVTFTTPDVIRSNVPYFDLEPFIQTMKGYHHLRLIFVTPAGFQFTGLRNYEDRNVRISLDQLSAKGGTTYTYNVNVLNSRFQALHLPTWQADPAQLKVAEKQKADKRLLLVKIFGAILVAGVASLVGYLVYNVLAVKGNGG